MTLREQSASVAVPSHSYESLTEFCKLEGRSTEDVLVAAIKFYIGKHNNKSRAQAAFKPQKHLREASIEADQAALLFIDVQNFNCHPDGALYQGNHKDEQYRYWWERMQDTKPLWSAVQTACREVGVEVMYTVMQSLTQDGRDRSLDYKISGFHVPKDSFDAQVIECIQPDDDEIVVPKTSSSVFTTTNIDTLLRNLEVKQLILAGCLTDQCVESAVRDACDLNYKVTLLTDACCTYSEERHQNSLQAIKGYCRQRTCKEVLAELSKT